MKRSISTKELFYDRFFSSEMEQRRLILISVFDAIDAQGLATRLTRDELMLVLDEALTNAMEHGNKWDVRKRVHIKLWMEGEYLHVQIEDEGSGFDISNSGSEFEQGNKMSHRGRGLSLIRRFCTPLWGDSGRSIDLPIKLS